MTFNSNKRTTITNPVWLNGSFLSNPCFRLSVVIDMGIHFAKTVNINSTVILL